MFLFLAADLGGCAYFSGRRQPVLITSNPSGAQVYDQGKFIGVTPGFLPIRRRRDAAIELRFPDKTSKTVSLQTKYRWWDSFGGNALFLVYAPIGWGVDWWTGAAWDMADPPIEKTQLPDQGARLAIAPAPGQDSQTTDAVGRELQSRMSAERKFKILSYDKTFAQLDFYEAHRGLPVDQTDRRTLVTEIGADAVLLSKAELQPNNEIKVSGEIINVYDGAKIGERKWDLKLSDAVTGRNNRLRRYFHILPNTVFVNFSSYRADLQIAGVGLAGKAVPDGSTLEQVSRYVGAIGITRLNRPRKSMMGKFNYEFVPAANLSIKRVRFQLGTPPADQDFDRMFVSAGYGIEVGYQWSYGFPYLDLIPNVVWTKLEYDVIDRARSRENFTTNLGVELGYLYFINQHLVMKLYSRSFKEDTEVWQHAVSEILGADTKVSEIHSFFSGWGIGYHF